MCVWFFFNFLSTLLLCNVSQFLTTGARTTDSQSDFIALRCSVVVFVVLGVETVEDGPSEGKDGGSPCQAVAPVKLVVHPQRDRLDELDGEQNQAAHLQNRCV